ncbi:hypothetical protein D047_4702B, partial [Vibrio parahaemolyticus VPTS-2010_2]
HLPRWAHLF